ncbi:MAG: OstA-like protein [Aureispira sp.]
MTRLNWFLWVFFMLLSLLGKAQVFEAPPSPELEEDSSRIDIINIDKYKERSTDRGVFRELTGNVHLQQQEMHLWCDLGFIFPNKQIEAFDNVEMLQNDSIRIFSDTLYYDGITRFARLRQNVVLTDTSMTMFTEKLDYDLNTRIAYFPEQALIESDSSTLISKRGTYNANTNEAHFIDSVRITNPNYKLTADSLAFNTQTEVATFLGPTKVYNEEKIVYCEDGYYDSKNNYAELYKNARFENYENEKEEIATGDTIIYDGSIDRYYLIGNAHFENKEQEVDADTIVMDGETEQYFFIGNPQFRSKDSTSNQSIQALTSDYDAINNTMMFRGDVVVYEDAQIIKADSLDYNTEEKNGLARGNVVWIDTAANVRINCGRAYYNDSTGYLLAQKEPMLTTLIDNDSLWLKADTLISLPDTAFPEQRNLYAYNNVRVFKSDMQARCDSLFYDGVDSTFELYQDPKLWVDENQFTADTVRMRLRSSKLDKVLLYENSLVVSTKEDTFFNQIKGRDAVAQFIEGKLSTMQVTEEGETVYYATDDKGAYMFVNDIDCENMLLFFSKSNLKRIKYQGKPAAVVYPMHQVDHQSLLLDGFRWVDSLRIKSKYELWGVPEPEPIVDSLFLDALGVDSLTLDSTLMDSFLIDSNSQVVPTVSDSSNTAQKQGVNNTQKNGGLSKQEARKKRKKKKGSLFSTNSKAGSKKRSSSAKKPKASTKKPTNNTSSKKGGSQKKGSLPVTPPIDSTNSDR